MEKRTLEKFGTENKATGESKAIFEKWPDNKLSRMALIAGTGLGAYIGYEQASRAGAASPVKQAAYVGGFAVAGNLAAQVLTMLLDGAWDVFGPGTGSGFRGVEGDVLDQDGRYISDVVPTNKLTNLLVLAGTGIGAYLGYYQAQSAGADLARTAILVAIFAIAGNLLAQAAAALGDSAWGVLGPDAA